MVYYNRLLSVILVNWKSQTTKVAEMTILWVAGDTLVEDSRSTKPDRGCVCAIMTADLIECIYCMWNAYVQKLLCTSQSIIYKSI